MKSFNPLLLRWAYAPTVALLLFATISASATAADVTGELRKWHTVTISFDGPNTSEGASPSPFFHFRLNVTFVHGATGKTYVVPGFYAADGNAAATSATSGNQWRVHFTPDEEGTWSYTASFRRGTDVAISLNPSAGTPASFDGESGSFKVGPTNKSGADLRAKGMLRYVGQHYLQFAETGEYFLKNGSDTPENFLAYAGFDGTYDTNCGGDGIDNSLHSYTPHVADWQSGDPVWKANKGKGIIGAVNYLAATRANSQYMLTYNVDGGDGCDVWMWTRDDVRDRFDVSKLAQWEIVFSHMDALGLQLHFVLAERENRNALGGDGGLNRIRSLYFRELVARFGHHLAVQWNIGEEHNISNEWRIDYADYIRSLDPYDHPITIHSTKTDPIGFYTPGTGNPPDILGDPRYEATSIQGDAVEYNFYAVELRNLTKAAGRKWAIYGDEQSGVGSDEDLLRQHATWGNLMGGGAGVEWFTSGDQTKEDFSPEDLLRAQTQHAIDFFQAHLPFAEMEPDNDLTDLSGAYVYAKPGEVYAVYLPQGGSADLDLAGFNDPFEVQWYDPRSGGALREGTVATFSGGGPRSIGLPPSNRSLDWVALVRRQGGQQGGGGGLPSISVTPSSLDFGSVAPGSSPELTATVKNVGDAPLEVTQVRIAKSATDYFEIASGPESFTLAPGASQAVAVRFSPGEEGEFTARLRVSSDDPDQSRYDVPISGSSQPGGESNLPTSWTSQDIDAVDLTGSFSLANGVFTVEGSGNDVRKAETFHYVYRTLSGDGEIVARLHSQENTGDKARVGVMIRESLAPDSKHAMLAATPSNTALLWYRTGTGHSSSQSDKADIALPVWIRLVRSGGVLTGYVSQDGQSYEQVATQAINMVDPVYVGLVVMSSTDGLLTTARFDHVSAQGGGTFAAQMESGADAEATNAVASASTALAASTMAPGDVPDTYGLSQNYPNPFNPATRIEVKLPESQYVTLRVYDMLGREVSTLIDGAMAPGTHVVSWDARAMNSGMYVYRLDAGAFSASKVMLLLK